MATRPKAVIESRNGEKFSPITITKNVLTDDGQNLHDILSDRKEDMITPTIENSSSMFKVGQGDNVDYSSNVVNGTYESMVLKGKTMVNCIQEPSSQDVVLPYAFEDSQYVTINDTKESGALGVELKGQTLVNVHGKKSYDLSQSAETMEANKFTNIVKGENKLSFDMIDELTYGWGSFVDGGRLNLDMLKPNTKYLVYFATAIFPEYFGVSFRNGDGTNPISTQVQINKGGNYAIITTTNEIVKSSQILYISIPQHHAGHYEFKDAMIIEYQQGMENWDIPYFTDIQSVKAPVLHSVGKNLFDKSKVKYNTTLNAYSGLEEANNLYMSSDFINVEPNKSYTSNKMGVIFYYDKDKQYVGELNNGGDLPKRFTTPNNCKYVRVRCWKQYDTIEKQREIVELEQLEEGSAATPYEPHKSNTLSTPEDLELRGIGNVKDELNVATGELTQRIGEVVFDGSKDEKWLLHQISSYTTHTRFGFSLKDNDKPLGITHTELKCDKFTWINSDIETEHIKIDGGDSRIIFVYIQNSKLVSQNANGFKEWLSQNPITIQYELETPIVTKINLPSTLKSWNVTTHIYSEIPENTLYPILTHSNPTYPVILKPSTKYSIVANSYSNNHTNSAINFNLGGATASTTAGNRVTTITTPSTLSNELLTMSGRGNKLNNVMVIEGDVSGDEPYFEGMCDSKSPILSNVGENLFTTNNMRTGNIAGNSSTIEGDDISGNWQVTDYIPVKPLIEYYHSTSLYKFEKASFYDINKKIIYGTGVNNFKTRVISTPHQCAYVRYVVMKDSSTNNSLSLEELVSNNDIVVTQGSSNIAYEPHKSNTTTFNQKDGKTIVLRSLPNGVCDTLNVETGEYVQRIDEIVLNGSETEWRVLPYPPQEDGTHYQFQCWQGDYSIGGDLWNNSNAILADRLPSASETLHWGGVGKYGIGGDRSHFMITWEKNSCPFNDVTTLKAWLQVNPITVQYELETPITTKVDIQGFPYAYKDGHVQLSSGFIEQSLTPKVEYLVATNRNGQIRSNQKMVERHQKQLDRLQAMILTNLVNTQYEQALTNLKYDLKNVREEVK